MFQSSYDSQTAEAEKLRTLGASEEYFWLSETTFPHTTMILAEVEGITTVEAWREALDKVQQRYPLLSACVRKKAGERPNFETLPGTPLPFRVLPLDEVNLDALVAQEPATSFGYADGPLGRLTLCHSHRRCVVIFAAHPTVCDGTTNVQIIEDLIASVSGEVLGDPVPLLPSVEEFFGLGESVPYAERVDREAPSPDFQLDLPIPRVQRRLLHARDLMVLRETAQAEGTTVHGALLAAFFLAGRLSSPRWRTAPVQCFSSVDLRPMLNPSHSGGVLMSLLPAVIQPSDDLPFWEFARELKIWMREWQTPEAITRAMMAARGVVRCEGDPDDWKTIDPKGLYNHDLFIGNYGDPRVRTDFGGVTLKGLYPSVITGDIDTQSISALAMNGSLHITHVSRRPFPGFMEQACSILLNACVFASAAAV